MTKIQNFSKVKAPEVVAYSLLIHLCMYQLQNTFLEATSSSELSLMEREMSIEAIKREPVFLKFIASNDSSRGHFHY